MGKPSPPCVIDAPASMEDLGLPGVAYVWALLTAQHARLTIAPALPLTVHCLELLQQRGNLSAGSDPLDAPRHGQEQRTPHEGLIWRWCWPAYEVEKAGVAAQEFLREVAHQDEAVALGVQLWRTLVHAEAEHFYGLQLARHQFDIQWQQDMIFAIARTGVELSAAQWRYCGWAAVRHGASLVCQRSRASTELREALYKELTNRALALAQGRYGNCAFVPSVLIPESALARALTQHWLPLGRKYWESPPLAHALGP